MARGIARAPSANAYRGTIGRTQTETIHVTSPRGDLVPVTVTTTIDAVSDPDLVEKLYQGELNVATLDDTKLRLAVPVVYHDPAAEVMVLVLGDEHRHREIDERIRLYERLRADAAAVPAYAKNFGVAFGGAGLRAYLESRAAEALLARDRADVERAKSELHQAHKDLEKTRLDLIRQQNELDRVRAETRSRVISSVQQVVPAPAEDTTIGPAPRDENVTKPIGRHAADDLRTDIRHQALPALDAPTARDFHAEPGTKFETEQVTPFEMEQLTQFGMHTPGPAPLPAPPDSAHDLDHTPLPPPRSFDDDEPTGTSIVPQGADPLTTESFDLGVERDPWLERAAASPTSTLAIDGGRVRLALVAGEQIARGLRDKIDVRVLLHRASSYPVVVLLLGPPAALRVPSPTQLAVIALDIAAEHDRQVLLALAKRFELQVDVIARGVPVRRVRLVAPLAENVAYIVRAADDHLRGITADGETPPSFERARDLVLGAGYDLLGVEHQEAAEFRDDKLAQVKTAQQLRRALAIARRFARPSREDYLVTARGFPLPRWRELRRHVLESAVAWGIWMGPELAQLAVSEGLARSRRDLIVKLDHGFEELRKNQQAFDIDADAADDNAKAIAQEARALGVELRRKGTNGQLIKSEDHEVVSGSIERTPTAGIPRTTSTDELLTMLDDKKHRVAAAAELCDRADTRAAGSVIAAVRKMSRAEAVRILGKSVKFGSIAARPLIEGLGSSKAYLRHGCALALALLRTEEGTLAVIDLLLSEPTEIWREIARAIGQIGPSALMPLAAHVGRLGDRLTAASAERVSWALAHIGVRGGKAAVEQMAAGQSIMAPIATQALGLLETAARDEVRVRPGPQGARDVTVNRAFSRRFFEALEADRPDVAQSAIHELDASGPLELDEADLIVEEDDESELDESDLIQS